MLLDTWNGEHMTNYETLLKINDKSREHIKKLYNSGKLDLINECISYTEDLNIWISRCGNFSKYLLVKEAQDECIKSIIMCSHGFYKEAIITLRQFLEHMLFAILLSTNDYKYRLWKIGQFDMSWTQIVDGQNGVFGKEYIRVYAKDINDERSIELLTIAKNVYRECSEFVHGNYEKLNLLTENMDYDEKILNTYAEYFSNIKYLVSMALLIRFREILNDKENLSFLESIIMDNLGMLPETQLLYGAEKETVYE